MTTYKQPFWLVAKVGACGLLLLACGTGCLNTGKTLTPSFYSDDTLQYYSPGPEFRLTREAANGLPVAAAVQSEAEADRSAEVEAE